MLKKLLIAQTIITFLALGLDLYGCFNLSIYPAVISFILGILDAFTLVLYLRKRKRT